MGLLEIFKRKVKSTTENFDVKTDFKIQLDIVEKAVFAKLKPLGFKKNGRTFNRRLEGGIIQVINFQSERYSSEKFIVNLGVCVESLFKFQFQTESKKYYKEYECQIRDRLGILLTGEDYWWTITNDNRKITEEIIVGLETKGFEWFSGVETKEKIISNYGHFPYDSSPRTKLDIALIVWFDNKLEGAKLFREYYNEIKPAKSSHKYYVKDLAKELNIEL